MTANLSPFAYPLQPHARRHGPRGYKGHIAYQRYKPWLRDEFSFRCVYWLFRERWYPSGHAAFSVDHGVPQSLAPDRVCNYENLLYACSLCNSFKQDMLLPDPCSSVFADHLQVIEDGTIKSISPEGDRIVRVLQLDRPSMNKWQERMLGILARLAPFQSSAASELKTWFGFPDDLPNLGMCDPEGNDRPEGIGESYFERKRRNELADWY